MNEEQELFTTSAAARLIGRSSESVRAYARAGRIAATRTTTGLRLFRRADLERLAAELERA